MRYDYDKTNSEDLQDNIINWMIKIILLLENIITVKFYLRFIYF